MQKFLQMLDRIETFWGSACRKTSSIRCASDLLSMAWNSPGLSTLRAAADVNDFSDIDPAKLMAAAQTGDKRSYAELLAVSEKIIRTAARRAGFGGNLVEVVVQETLVTLHSARHTFDPTCSFTIWLNAISERCMTNLLRRQRRQAKRKTNSLIAFERQN